MSLRPFILLFALPSLASATTMRAASHAELVRLADAVVVGQATQAHSLWDGTRIMTETRVIIDDVWSGEAGEAIDVWTAGGIVGALGQHVPGAAHLAVGERYVLYLARDPAGHYHPIGMWQGVFVVTDPIAPDPPLARPPQTELVGPSPPSPPPLTLLSQRRAVLELVRAR